MLESAAGCVASATVGTAASAALRSIPGVAPVASVASAVVGDRLGFAVLTTAAGRVAYEGAVKAASAASSAASWTASAAWYGWPSLVTDVDKGDVAAVKTRLEAVPPPDLDGVYDGNGYTPLMIAMTNKNTLLVKTLLEAGANVNARHRDDRRTPLCIATQINRDDYIELLLSHKADITLTDAGFAPWVYAKSPEMRAKLKPAKQSHAGRA